MRTTRAITTATPKLAAEVCDDARRLVGLSDGGSGSDASANAVKGIAEALLDLEFWEVGRRR